MQLKCQGVEMPRVTVEGCSVALGWLKRVLNFLLYMVNDQNCVSVVSEAEHFRHKPNVVPLASSSGKLKKASITNVSTYGPVCQLSQLMGVTELGG